RSVGARRLALEHRGDLTLFIVRRFVPGREAIQNFAVFYFEVVVRPIDIAAGRLTVTGKMKHPVDTPHVIAIDDHEVAVRVRGKNIDPEIDVGLDRSRTRKWKFGLRRRVGRGRKAKCDRERKRCDYFDCSVCRQLRFEQRLLPRARVPILARSPGWAPIVDRPPAGNRLYELAPVAPIVNKFHTWA